MKHAEVLWFRLSSPSDSDRYRISSLDRLLQTSITGLDGIISRVFGYSLERRSPSFPRLKRQAVLFKRNARTAFSRTPSPGRREAKVRLKDESEYALHSSLGAWARSQWIWVASRRLHRLSQKGELGGHKEKPSGLFNMIPCAPGESLREATTLVSRVWRSHPLEERVMVVAPRRLSLWHVGRHVLTEFAPSS
jgi:hypothetical protein